MFGSLAPLVAALTAAATLLPAPAAADPRGDQLDGKLYAATERLEQVIEEYNEVRDDLRTTHRKLAELAEQTRPLERAVAVRQARVALIARAEYRNSGAGPVLAVLTADSPEDFADRLLVLDRLAAEQRAAVEQLTAARSRYEQSRRALETAAKQQQAQQERLTNRREQVERDIAQLERLRVRSGYRPATGVRGFKPVFSPGQAGTAVRFAYAQLGKAYRFGAGGPDAYDCSGLTSAAWSRAGVTLPHNARRQQRAVQRVDRSDLRPGDLVFYYRNVRHVGMYVGSGKIIHAPQHGEPVRIDNVDYQPVHSFGRPG
ncbi:C40 family peptidase [Phytohabitans kaempferiae]|uniref:NlpC/P60 family protein n=1 Tax=Phytohabitans kaempferiae TaxID=1620943 RepID=A0ABV6LVX0_9ACTN